jgi:hypothetical protein
MSVLHFLADWFEDAPNAAMEERATACDLRIYIGDQNVCLHLDGLDGALYDHVTMPAYSLVEGLARDWWNIFGARDTEYRLIRHRMGYATPDVRFRFDGIAFDACSYQRNYGNPDVRFWAGPTEVMSRLEAENVLAQFIEDVLKRLREKGIHQTSAELRWQRVQASRSNLEETEFCEAAGALGVDPYALNDEESDFLVQSAQLFRGEPLIEFLAGVPRQILATDILTWIRRVEDRPSYLSRLPNLRCVAEHVSNLTPPRSGDRSWALGYRRARVTRKALNRTHTDRIRGTSELAALFGNKSFRRAGRINGLRALISLREQEVHIHLRDRPPTPEARVSELFAFTRAIGDAICFPNTPRSVVNELHDADRQAAARAFAAEFLAPIDEVLSMQADNKDLATIADELNVSNEVVQRQVENKDRIAAACV